MYTAKQHLFTISTQQFYKKTSAPNIYSAVSTKQTNTYSQYLLNSIYRKISTHNIYSTVSTEIYLLTISTQSSKDPQSYMLRCWVLVYYQDPGVRTIDTHMFVYPSYPVGRYWTQVKDEGWQWEVFVGLLYFKHKIFDIMILNFISTETDVTQSKETCLSTLSCYKY